MASARQSAEDLREFGNVCLAKGKLDAAIAAYSEAICLSPNAAYYTNRAQAHKRKGVAGWARLVIDDCESALALDDKSIKAHYLLGGALSDVGDFVRATEHLRRALGLTAQTSVLYEADIRAAMLRANKRRWEDETAAAVESLDAAMPLLHELAEQLDAAAMPLHARASSPVGAGEAKRQQRMHLSTVRRALDAHRASLVAPRAPEYLQCAISLELLREPVITPCGHTFERSCIEDHLRRGHHFNPVSRAPLALEQLVPNLAVKAAVEAFLAAHPGAYESLE